MTVGAFLFKGIVMKELIKIEEKNGEQLVSARELHEFLTDKSSERFSKWWDRMISYGFDDQVDFTPYQKVHPQNNQKIIDYALTLDCAKEMSMLQKSEKGKQARKYFIECEKKSNNRLSQIDLIIQSAQYIKDQEQRMDSIEERIVDIENKPQINAPIEHFSILGYCNNINLQIDVKKAAEFGRKCSRLCKEIGLDTGSVPDPRFGKVKTYPLNVLEQVIG